MWSEGLQVVMCVCVMRRRLSMLRQGGVPAELLGTATSSTALCLLPASVTFLSWLFCRSGLLLLCNAPCVVCCR